LRDVGYVIIIYFKSREKMIQRDVEYIGETGLLDLIEKRLERLGLSPLGPISAILGFGDDCASIRVDESFHVLLSTDLLVEDIHFRKGYFSPYQLGYKALAVNISDVAAMGGMPAYVLVGLAIPSGLSTEFVDELYDGLIKTGEKYGVRVIGGDTVGSTGPVMLSITILGAVEEGNIVTRKGAKPGNRIMVTGELGSAMMGLEILEDSEVTEKPERKDNESNGLGRICDRFIHPVPRIKEARIIAKKHLATSMIDLSDSLSQDLAHICRSSEVGARIKKEFIPIAPEVKRLANERGKDPFLYALTGGEDYEILFTVRSEYAELTKELVLKETGTLVHEIGEICPAEEGVILIDETTGDEKPIIPCGFNHFATDNKNL
jgi:thiamine-monophosphate kinase